MKIDKPLTVAVLALLIVFEVIYIAFDGATHYKYFRDFIDAVVLLTVIVAIYFVWEYLRAKRQIPVKANKIVDERAAKFQTRNETDQKVKELMRTEAFKQFERQMSSRVSRSSGHDQNDEFLTELEAKEE